MKRAAIAVLLLGCGAAPDPSPVSARDRTRAEVAEVLDLGAQAFGLPPGGRLESPQRPAVTVARFGYGGLPLVDLAEGPGRGRTATLSFQRAAFRFDEPLLADLKVGSSEGFTGAPDLKLADVGIAAPPYERCPNDGVVSDARWFGLPVHGFSDASIEIEIAEGRFLWEGCESVIDRSARFRAPAIVPGFVYAFRTRARPELATADEELVVILPPTAWSSVTGSPGGARVRQGAFTIVRLPVDREAGASFVVRLAPEQLVEWEDLRNERRPPRWVEPTTRLGDMLVFAVDVAVVSDRAEGTYTFGLSRALDRTPFEPFLRAAQR